MISNRGYITPTELERITGLGLTEEEAIQKINAAELLIDAYVGYQERAVTHETHGEVTAAVEKTLFDIDERTQLGHFDDYFSGCQLEIIGGPGSGQTRRIVSSSYQDRSITYEGDALNPAPTAGIVFKISQLGKFPRRKDMTTNRDGNRYYKTIPDAVKQATAAQVAFMVEKGDDFFSGDSSTMQSESMGNYAYSRGSNGNGVADRSKLVSPKVKTLLGGIMNRTGRIVVSEP